MKDPLAQFNHTLPDKNGIWQLVSTLNRQLKENALSERIIERVFELYWPEFEKEFNKIIQNTPVLEIPVKRNNEDIMGEILNSVRSFDKRLRSIERNYSRNKSYDSSTPKEVQETIDKIKGQVLTYNSQGLSKEEARKKINENLNITIVEDFYEVVDGKVIFRYG